MDQEEVARPALAQRLAYVLDRAESVYLRVLRAVILVLASLLLAYAAWLAVSSLYKISQSPDSVQEAPAVVAADELTDAEMPARKTAGGAADSKPVVNSAQQRYYSDVNRRYYELFRTRFEPFRQKEDKQLTRDGFDDSFLNTTARLEAAKSGELDFEADKADLETLLKVMTEASQKPVTQERLQRYRSARKVAVSRKIQRTRTTSRSGWDSTSTECATWYMEPIGCPVTRTVETPYTQTVTTMQFPQGTQSHIQIFRAFQDRFFSLLEQRRAASADKAESERQGILAGIADGRMSLVTALQILGGFLVLMFFFLLIAIERHQRRLAASQRLADAAHAGSL